MKRLILMFIAFLFFGITAQALTPTLSPSPIPESNDNYIPIMGSIGVRAFFNGEWHGLASEMIWMQEKRPDGQDLYMDGILHFMPLNKYVEDKALPEAMSLDRFTYQITIDENVNSASNHLIIYRQDGDDLQRLGENPERWEDLEAGRYLFSINISASGNDSSINCVSLLWVNR